MRTFLILLFTSLLHQIFAQYENQPMPFYPIPVILRFPEPNQNNPINYQYSFTNNDKTVEAANTKVPLNGIDNFRVNTRRFDSPVEVPYRVTYEEGPRNVGYEERPGDFYSKFHNGASKNWQPMKQSEQRSGRPRYSRKDALSVHKSILMNDHFPQTVDAKRTPRIVKYIADENGVALREDILQNLKGGASGSRRRPRIVTAASSPLMSKVVTSAIRVSNHQSVNDGKYMPQIIDMKIGK